MNKFYRSEIMLIFKYFFKCIVSFLGFYKMRWRVWMKFHVFLPRSAVIALPDAIKIGRDFFCGPRCEIYCQDPENGSELIVGNRVALNSNVTINADCGGKIYIGDNVIMGPNVLLRASNHIFYRKNIPIRDQGHKGGIIVIEEDVWLGGGVIVLPDVRIGKGSVIGAGSVVTKDIPPYSVAVGVPAKVIKRRGEEGVFSKNTNNA